MGGGQVFQVDTIRHVLEGAQPSWVKQQINNPANMTAACASSQHQQQHPRPQTPPTPLLSSSLRIPDPVRTPLPAPPRRRTFMCVSKFSTAAQLDALPWMAITDLVQVRSGTRTIAACVQ